MVKWMFAMNKGGIFLWEKPRTRAAQPGQRRTPKPPLEDLINSTPRKYTESPKAHRRSDPVIKLLDKLKLSKIKENNDFNPASPPDYQQKLLIDVDNF